MLEKIKELLAKQLRIDIDTIADDSNIIEDLGADSLDVVEMLMAIEDDLGVNMCIRDSWNTSPQSWRSANAFSSSVVSMPPTVTRPPVGVRMPQSSLASVLLPLPLCPMMAV